MLNRSTVNIFPVSYHSFTRFHYIHRSTVNILPLSSHSFTRFHYIHMTDNWYNYCIISFPGNILFPNFNVAQSGHLLKSIWISTYYLLFPSPKITIKLIDLISNGNLQQKKHRRVTQLSGSWILSTKKLWPPKFYYFSIIQTHSIL